MRFRLALAALLAAGIAAPAFAAPARIVILRHGEKADTWQLCATGVERAAALAAHYLGKGAAGSLFGAGGPDAIMAITLHSLELVSPAAASWSLPIVLWSAVPGAGEAKPEFTVALNARTRQAAADLLGNPHWDGKTVVMAWEHDHIANAKLDAANAGAPVTLYRLLGLDAFADVPATWPGENYDYFLDVRLDAATGKPTGVGVVRQVFPAPFAALPSNAWGEPNGLTAASGCEH